MVLTDCQVIYYYYTIRHIAWIISTPMGPTMGLSVTEHQGERGQEMIMVMSCDRIAVGCCTYTISMKCNRLAVGCCTYTVWMVMIVMIDGLI